jgi:hypothetical protein
MIPSAHDYSLMSLKQKGALTLQEPQKTQDWTHVPALCQLVATLLA